MRCLFGLFGALAQVGGVAEAEDFAGKFSERAVDLIFGPLNGEHVHKIQRGSVELFEHLVAGAPLSQEALADLTERSEEHTSELQSLMRISYAVFCLKKKKNTQHHT